MNLAKFHPKWNLKTLQKRGCSRLKRMDDLSQWEKQITSGGSIFDRLSIIDTWTYDRFIEARQNNQQVTTRNLQQWALTAAGQFPDLKFKASDRWVNKFKNRHNIRQRKGTKFVLKRETISMEDTLASAETFRRQGRRLIPNFNQDYVINTDQTVCMIFSKKKCVFVFVRGIRMKSTNLFVYWFNEEFFSSLPISIHIQSDFGRKRD